VSRMREQIEVAVPVRVAYEQWTDFESFPRFMAGIDRVVQVDDRTLEWTATVAGVVKHWQAEITEQRPNEVVAWRSTAGARNDGRVRFRPLDAERTMVEVELDVEPEGLVEKAGDALGVVERRVRGDMVRFRDYVESRPEPVGAWRARASSRPIPLEGPAADEPEPTDGAPSREPTEIGRPR
jgi:uncharacterized membrane protein